MRWLLDFIMRGRTEAILVALIGNWFLIIPQAVVALVTLRKGWQEGAIITIAAMIPAFFGIFFGQLGVIVVYASISVLVVAYLLALVLRATVSWPAMLSACVALGCFTALLVQLDIFNLKENMLGFFAEIEANLPVDDTSSVEKESIINSDVSVVAFSGVLALISALTALLGVIVGRWWQAILYNPGGFKAEFHAIRLPPSVASISALAFGYCAVQEGDYIYWLVLFALPMVIAGLAVMHHILGRWKISPGYFVLVYVLLLIFQPMLIALVIVGLTDTWINYREKFQFKR